MARVVSRPCHRWTFKLSTLVVLICLGGLWQIMTDERRLNSTTSFENDVNSPNNHPYLQVFRPLSPKVDETDVSNATNVSNLSRSNTTSTKSYDNFNPWPMVAFRQYQKRHSAHILQKEFSGFNSSSSENLYNGRKFAKATYWCPDRAGNLLHSLFNSMIWAMITNRTLLVEYEQLLWKETDQSYCQSVLSLAEWLPTWEEWSHKLALPDPVPVSGPLNIDDYTVVMFPQIPDVHHENTSLTREDWNSHPWFRSKHKAEIARLSQESRDLTVMLYNLGVEFLMGMLFRQSFSYGPRVQSLDKSQPKEFWDSNAPDNVFSIALHSRHTVLSDDGTFIQEEKDCLQGLLDDFFDEQRKPERINKSGTTPPSCRVYIMSDRTVTIQLLRSWLVQNYNCTVLFTQHDDENHGLGENGRHTEHGPHAGIGFVQDLKLASLARSAVVGDPHRSSSMLLMELIEYDRFVEAWQYGYDPKARKPTHLVPLQRCPLRMKPVSGYNYGPGTPTFRHFSKQAKFEPVKVMDDYVLMHSSDQLLSEESDELMKRKYVVVDFKCDPNFFYQLFNGT